MTMHDLVIIGGGPAGLSAALNGAAEGLDVLLLERGSNLGGQAGTSSRIENYLGFAEGISGERLTDKAMRQAERLGASLKVNSEVTNVNYNPATGLWVTECDEESHLSSAVLIAVGVDYRRLGVPGGDSDMVIYGAPASAHEEMEGKNVVVVGGGNSAGQAALSLAGHAASVTLLVRRPLRNTMSQYLVKRIAMDKRIHSRLGEITEVRPETNEIVCRCNECVTLDGPLEEHIIPADVVFAYIGSEPRTDFLSECCTFDAHGFVTADTNFRANDHGLFVAGDVRSGSAKRVAVASGEGAISAAGVWQHLNTD